MKSGTVEAKALKNEMNSLDIELSPNDFKYVQKHHSNHQGKILYNEVIKDLAL